MAVDGGRWREMAGDGGRSHTCDETKPPRTCRLSDDAVPSPFWPTAAEKASPLSVTVSRWRPPCTSVSELLVTSELERVAMPG